MEKRRIQESNAQHSIKNDILGILLISLSIFCLFGMYSSNTGSLGKFLDKMLKGFAGGSAVLIPFVVIIFGFIVIFNRDKHIALNRIWGIIILFIITASILHILSFGEKILDDEFVSAITESIDSGYQNNGGGIIGFIASYVLLILFGRTGAYIILGCSAVIGIILTTNISLINIFTLIKNVFKTVIGKIAKIKPPETLKKDEIIIKKEEDFEETPNLETAVATTTSSNEAEKEDDAKIEKQLNHEQQQPEKDVEIAEQLKIEQIDDDKYRLPPKYLLNSGYKRKGYKEKDLLKNAKLLEKTLESFGVKAKVSQVSCGPAITRYEVQPAPGVKVSRIVTLSDDIALSLAASDVRIEAPIPGKAAVGIEVPNKNISLVTLKEVIESKKFKESKSNLTIALGKDIAGTPIVADLSDMPHLLVAGATGSGKSVCINGIITSILYKASPNDVKFLLIDPKVVELTTFNGIPHLITPVVTDAEKAASALHWAVREMEKRYRSFAKNGVRDIKRYNEKVDDSSNIPEIVVIIDELADLMMVSPTEVEDSICRLAQKARAAGIHLVVATQRPSVDVITGVIKANIPSRISFAVSSQTDSRTILDMNGAEKLLGKGDMLFYPVGAVKPKRLQGCFISEKEVERVVDYVKKQGEPVYKEEVTQTTTKGHDKNIEEVDELFYDALKLIVDYGQASISLLQRRLHIGYTRAARIIDEMEARGFVGGYEGTKPREVLISENDLQKMIQGINDTNPEKNAENEEEK